MSTPPTPNDENERLAALHAARILDTPPEEIFDRITRLVAHTLNVPIALISLVDENRQWFKSKVGLDATETSRDISFCGHALLEQEALIVVDASKDDRFMDNPLVTGSPKIRFYAGIPLLSAEGHAFGTLCSIDHTPRELKENELAILHDLAGLAEALIQHRQLAMTTKDLLLSLKEREARYRHLIESSPDAFLIHEEGIIRFINVAGLRLLNADHEQQLLGQQILSIVPTEYLDIIKERIKCASDGRDNPSLELEWIRLDGSRISVEARSIPFGYGNKRAVQVIARDISERKRTEGELVRLATNDALTGLPNRTLLMDRLSQGILRWQRQQKKAVIAFLGLDHFKQINDTFGNDAGDKILKIISKNIQKWLRQSDTAARIGGDEFVLIIEDVEDEAFPPKILQRIFEHISHPILIDTQEITVAASIGFCWYPEDGTNVDTLLNAATTAMYRAKHLGRSNIQQYASDMRTQANERFVLESQLRLAIERNELILHYQPKVDLLTGRIIGVEALIRWQHPQMGLVPPMRFIPAAEQSGLIIPMGEWIIRTACQQISSWKSIGLTDVSIAINLSGLQFLQQNIISFVKKSIQENDIDPHLLEFELTESMSMGDPEKSIAIMREFKAIGVGLSIDDFGTGYSNLSHLKRFPVDKLKIDKSFISDMTSSSEALAIVKAIIAMAHSLHLLVIAEGVENGAQLGLLRMKHCDQIQGYYFSKPLPEQECTALILSKR